MVATGLVITGGIVIYMFNMPHRNVQNTSTDYSITVKEVVNEYLTDADKANNKYLDSEGESKILEVTGMVSSITEDFNKQKVVLLKAKDLEAGVSCTFIAGTNESVSTLKEGDKVTIKGVIRSGASYDEDLEMYENVIMEKCSIASK